jgi:hypothetical protein
MRHFLAYRVMSWIRCISQIFFNQGTVQVTFVMQKVLKITMVLAMAMVGLECMAGVDDYDGRVYFALYHPGQELNPFVLYPPQINYYIDPRLRGARFTLDGEPYIVDMAGLTESAMREWQQALAGDVEFRPVSSEAEAQLVIAGNFDAPPSIQTAATEMATAADAGHAAHNPRVTYNLVSMEASLNPRALEWYRTEIMRDGTSNAEILRMFIRYTALHELGHVLGFDHPNGRIEPQFSDEHFDWDAWRRYRRVVVVPRYDYTSIPLMEANTRHYFQMLRNRLGPLRPDDPAISPQERAALARLRRRAQQCSRPDRPSQVSGHGAILGVGDDDCAPLSLIGSAPMAAVSLLLGS